MLVYERMMHHPMTVHPDLPVAEALRLMREENVRRFPVVSRKNNELVGMVTEKELLYATPSSATSLSIHEINYLLAKLTVEKVMTADPVTVTDDTPIEEAARIMMDHDVSALPVMRGGRMIGIITETDLFQTFIELFAAREEGVRMTLLVPEGKGKLVEISRAITDAGGNIITLGTFRGEDLSNRLLMIKIDGVAQETLTAKMSEIGARVVDIRTCQPC